jgi:hypothetical protein
MKKRAGLAVVAALALSAGGAVAMPLTRADFSPAATDINFDNLTGGSDIFTGDLITTQYAGQGVTFANPQFDTRANASPLGSSAITDSKPNVAFIMQGSGESGSNVPPEELHFSIPINKVGMSFFLSLGADVTLDVFGIGNTLLESETLTGTAMASGLQEGFIGLGETSAITEATITSHGPSGQSFNFSIDDVLFEGPKAVPEPATLMLLSLGLAGLGLSRRRRGA